MAGSSANAWTEFLKKQNAGPPIAPTVAPFGSPQNFNAAASTQAKDYDSIMSGYDDLIKSVGSSASRAPAAFNPIAPTLTNYSQSPAVSGAMSNLSQLSTSGGYTDEDKSSIRNRAISPIRSIYANAQRNLERSRVLQGGYSPNYTAASGQMARELSEQIGQVTTGVEADIAQNTAQNRLAIAPSYASFAGNENAARTAVDQNNAEAVNRSNEMNMQMALQYENLNRTLGQSRTADILAAIEGKRGLYGTTPALTNTFGQQVAQAGQLGQSQQQLNEIRKRELLNGARFVYG